MPYLDWKSAAIEVDAAAHPELETRLRLSLARTEIALLHSQLKEVLATGSTSELRVDFPQGWTVYWKLRPGESRFLLAHPEKTEWTATLGFTAEHAESLLLALHAIHTGEFAVSLSHPLQHLSNLEVVIHLAVARI